MTFGVGCQLADICYLMGLLYCRVASNGMKQLCITLVAQGSCLLAIGPTLGTRFGLSWAYHSSQKGWLVLRAYSG